MAKPLPTQETPRGRGESERRSASPEKSTERPTGSGEPGNLGIWRGEEKQRPTTQTAEDEANIETPDPSSDLPEVERLRAENEDLRATVADLRQMLDEATAKNQLAIDDLLAQQQQAWSEREKEFESLLEEKSEVIRNLHLKMQEASKHSREGGLVSVSDEQELLALSDELERERCNLEQERRQLDEDRRQQKEDERTMMEQMREMEVQMARERAELARQRNELQRLHNEIRHEFELAQRDAMLNERLRALQRKHQDVANRRGAAPETPPAPERPAAEPPPDPNSAARSPNKDSGLLRRIFGNKPPNSK